MSFGSEYWHTKECTHSANVSEGLPQPWDLERLVFRQPLIHCVHPKRYPNRRLCEGHDGHRKYVVNPRKVTMLGVRNVPSMGPLWFWISIFCHFSWIFQIHSVVKPQTGGLNIDTNEAHLKHFRGWNLRGLQVCRQFIKDSDWIPKSWARDFSMNKVAKLAHLQASKLSVTNRT